MPFSHYLISGLISFFILKRLIVKPLPSNLPPGPRPLPFLGNLLHFPQIHPWKTFAEWSKVWGDIVYVSLLGQPFIIINSPQIASDMFDKKSTIYSDRPTLTFASEMVGYKNILPLASYELSQRIRRLLHRVIGSRASVQDLYPLEERCTRQFLKRVLKSPEDLIAHIRWSAGAVILEATYGYKVAETNDPLVEVVDRAMMEFSLSTEPGAYIVDFLPSLRYVPGWVPGFGFQKQAIQYAKNFAKMVEMPFQFAKSKMTSGDNSTCFTANLLQDHTPAGLTNDQNESHVKLAAAAMYGGGADTVVSVVSTFFLVMTLYPGAQKKAQAELDAVVGDRLPTYSDLPNLPYLNAFISELLRWHPVLPLVIHMNTEDDIYDGLFIPKGSIIMANVWSILHDPEVYPNPQAFNPDRFLPKDGQLVQPDPRDVVFGFGRRICPGIHLAEIAIFISVAMSLSVFNISKAVGEDGVTLEPVVDYTSGTMTHPKPFKYSIKPRSRKAEELIMYSAAAEAEPFSPLSPTFNPHFPPP